MPLERIRSLLDSFRDRVSHAATPAGAAGSGPGRHVLPPADAVALLESMLLTRHLDAAAHELRARNEGHYTICSSGHEANAVFGRLTRTTDPALVHYRSGAFQRFARCGWVSLRVAHPYPTPVAQRGARAVRRTRRA